MYFLFRIANFLKNCSQSKSNHTSLKNFSVIIQLHIFQYCLGAVWIRHKTFIVDHISVPVISVNRHLYREESEVLDWLTSSDLCTYKQIWVTVLILSQSSYVSKVVNHNNYILLIKDCSNIIKCTRIFFNEMIY